MTSPGVRASGDPAQTEIVPDHAPGAPGAPGASIETQHVPDVPDLPRFGRYRALARLGAGATGVVYGAEDEVLGRPVAIKVLHAHSDPATRERFLREARAFGAAPHPNILAIYDGGTEGQTPYLVMELAPGGSLRERLRSGPLPVDGVRRLGIQIARALAAAHAAGILHRDVKPANILAATPERWKLADFGIARLPDSTMTVTGQFLGSPSYAAPESLRAGQFAPASDVYALGATLYEALAGVPPYGDHDAGALARKLEGQAPPPLAERCAVPRPVADAIMAALALDPARRPSAEALASLLAAVDERSRPAAPPPIRSRRALLAGAAVAVAVVVVAILASGGSSPASSPASSSGLDPREPPREPRAPEPPGPPEAPAAPAEPAEPAEPADPAAPAEPRPAFVDQDGNPIDEATARQILEAIERARDEDRPGRRGRGKWKKHKDHDD